jgi:hypothetical protein
MEGKPSATWPRLLLLLLAAAAPARAATLQDAVDEATKGNAAAAEAQERIDTLSGDIDQLATEYRTGLQQIRALEVYNKQLQSMIASQEDEKTHIGEQIEEVTHVGREVLPMMSRMVDTLARFVELDLPFLPEERATRIAGLHEMMDRADVTISEKYRRILEAYQIENEYGRTIEAYGGEIKRDGATLTVDFLRIGRIALLYQTLDGQHSGMWDREAHDWKTLGGEYRIPIRRGLQMAQKQTAPDLVEVPLPPVETVQVKTAQAETGQ